MGIVGITFLDPPAEVMVDQSRCAAVGIDGLVDQITVEKCEVDKRQRGNSVRVQRCLDVRPQ